MHIFCSKALADALNIKKNELQKMPVDAQIDELYAWHGHITKLNGKNTIILMNDRTMYSLIFRNRLPRNVDKFAELIKEAITYTMEVGGFNNPEIDKYMSGVGEIIFAEKADRQMTGEAYIISDVSGERQAYHIMMDSFDYSPSDRNKGIHFYVDDERLLSLTGGIVQGMSGSPIIQDGRIVGAVTHVLIQDSSRGYGIFIDEMLSQK